MHAKWKKICRILNMSLWTQWGTHREFGEAIALLLPKDDALVSLRFMEYFSQKYQSSVMLVASLIFARCTPRHSKGFGPQNFAQGYPTRLRSHFLLTTWFTLSKLLCVLEDISLNRVNSTSQGFFEASTVEEWNGTVFWAYLKMLAWKILWHGNKFPPPPNSTVYQISVSVVLLFISFLYLLLK